MSPLVEYTKTGLRNCYMKDQKCWSYIYHLDGRDDPNESYPAGDAFYSLNVILGLASLGKEAWEGDYDLPSMLQENARKIFELSVPRYAIGMALWASAELGVPLAPDTDDKIQKFIKDRNNWSHFRAQDAGMILTGIAEQSLRGNHTLDQEAHDLYRFIRKNFLSKSGLFFNSTKGLRKHFGSFATQTYLTTALYHYGVAYKDNNALSIADAATKKLIALQGKNGEWPWFYFVPRGLVVDIYEVYSVHQHGMAPLFLTFAEKRGIPGAREAIIKGFEWIFSNNQLKKNMMHPELGMFYRSIIRREELSDKKKRATRAIINGLIGKSDKYAPEETLTLRKECRSYELGWILYSFGSRTDVPDLTHHRAFSQGGASAAIPVVEGQHSVCLLSNNA